MIDSFPYQEWITGVEALQEGAFWPYSEAQEGSAGTWVLTILGIITTIAAIIGWIIMDNRMLNRHAERLRAAGFGRRVPPAGS